MSDRETDGRDGRVTQEAVRAGNCGLSHSLGPGAGGYYGVFSGIMGYSQEGHITTTQGLIRGIQIHCIQDLDTIHAYFNFWMFLELQQCYSLFLLYIYL